MKSVLSIQSHVVFGHVGNSSAVFPMQRMGVEVLPVHTVQFSNHTQYPQGWHGRTLPAMDISDLLYGLSNIDETKNIDAVISGYQGSDEQCEAIASAILKLRKSNPSMIYVCDPVMGNPEKGCIVREEVTNKLVSYLMPFADIITPNQFELTQFTNIEITDEESAIRACKVAMKKGPYMVLVKNLNLEEDCFTMMLATKMGIYVAKRPKIEFERDPVGVGDLITAIFTACIMNGKSPMKALKFTNNAVYGVMQTTKEMGKWEIQIIAAQREFQSPSSRFTVERAGAC
ncbi:MAG: pyridoxal kinase PdxY [Vibrio splendidus]